MASFVKNDLEKLLRDFDTKEKLLFEKQEAKKVLVAPPSSEEEASRPTSASLSSDCTEPSNVAQDSISNNLKGMSSSLSSSSQELGSIIGSGGGADSGWVSPRSQSHSLSPKIGNSLGINTPSMSSSCSHSAWSSTNETSDFGLSPASLGNLFSDLNIIAPERSSPATKPSNRFISPAESARIPEDLGWKSHSDLFSLDFNALLENSNGSNLASNLHHLASLQKQTAHAEWNELRSSNQQNHWHSGYQQQRKLPTTYNPGANQLMMGYSRVVLNRQPSRHESSLSTSGEMTNASSVLSQSNGHPMNIHHKFGNLGASAGQFNAPHGFCLGVNEEIVVADTNNHRIQVFSKDGHVLGQFGIAGKEEGHLWFPRKVTVIRSTGHFVICDRGSERSRMQVFDKQGVFVRRIAIHYINIVAGVAINRRDQIVAVDSVTPTVFIIDPWTGDLVKYLECSELMNEPSDIAVYDREYYICDFKGHCVVVLDEDGRPTRRIGDDTVTCYPNGIDISDQGDILVGDSHGNQFHVAVFDRYGRLASEFMCPHVKVSRCCGLKINSKGFVVTLAKNNHHVLVLDTLYIE